MEDIINKDIEFERLYKYVSDVAALLIEGEDSNTFERDPDILRDVLEEIIEGARTVLSIYEIEQ